MREDNFTEAIDLTAQLDLINATLLQVQADRKVGKRGTQGATQTLAPLLEPLPAFLLAYYREKISSIFNKRVVKKGFSSSVLYANLALLAVFARVVAPRMLAANNMDELFEAGGALGIPDRESLTAALDTVASYDTWVKIAAYTGLFVLEKLTLLSDILPIQIGLKTVAPAVFGGLIPGAIASAACETLGAALNFVLGRTFLTDRVAGFSAFGSDPVGEQRWYGKLTEAAANDGFRLTLLLRLAPVLPIPFDTYWWLLGALPVALPEFALAHFLGCFKTAFLDASFGVLLLSAVVPQGGELQEQAQQIVLVETAAFAIVAVLAGTVATRLINELLGLDDPDEEEDEAAEPAKLAADMTPEELERTERKAKQRAEAAAARVAAEAKQAQAVAALDAALKASAEADSAAKRVD